MRKERVELSILRHKSAMRGSAVALTARTAGRISSGRTQLGTTLVKNADVQIVVFPVMDSLPYDPLNRSFSDAIETRTKSLEQFSEGFRKHVAHGGMISEWGDPVSGIDVKKLRSLKATARGYDPNAVDADGDMLVQEGTPWQRLTTRVRRAVKKGKRRLADAADSAAERIEDRVERRASRRGERGSLRERVAGAAERAAARIDGGEAAPKPKKKRRTARQYMVGYTDEERRQMAEGDEPEAPKPPKAEEPDKPEIAVDEDGKPEAPSPAKPLPEDDDDEWAKAFNEWKKNSGATEDITADTTAESKMPGKKYGTGTKDRDTALLGARDASKKNKDKTLHVVKGTDGKFRVVDDERLEAMGGKPVAAYKDGKIVMRDGAPVKKGKDSATFKDIDAADGWSGGGKFANEETAVNQASNIKNTVYPDKDFGPDDNIHVVKAEGGMFALVDDEKLQALGVDPVASFNGDGKEIPWGATDPKPKKPKKEKKPKPVGEIPGEEPMPTLEETLPKPEVAEDAKKKKPKLGGKQFGRPFKNEKSAVKRADELSKDGGKYHVVSTDQGFRVVDQERLDAMGVDPVHTGGEFKPAPGMKPAEVKPGAKKTSLELGLKPYMEEDNAVDVATELAFNTGETHWVVEDDGGFYVADEEQLDQLYDDIEVLHKITKEDATGDADDGEAEKPTKESVQEKINSGDIPFAMMLNDTMGGEYTEEEIGAYKQVFDNAVAEMEALTPEERKLLGKEYDETLEGLKNNQKILQRVLDEDITLDEAVEQFWAGAKDQGKDGDAKPVASQEIPKLSKWPVIGENPESSWDKLVEDGDVATLQKLREAFKQVGKSIGKEGPAVDWAKKYVKLLDEKIKAATKNSKKKQKAPKKPLGNDENPVVYNPATGVMADISPAVDSIVGSITDPKDAKEKLDEIESEVKKIAKKFKPAGSKGGPDGPWANYDADQILTALSEVAMDGDTPAQKRAAQLLLDLIDDEALDLTSSGNKRAEQVAEVFAATAKKKISSMSKQKLDEETGIPSPEPGDTSVGALAGFTEKLKSFDVLMDENTDFDEKIEQLWALKADVDSYIQDLKNEAGDSESDKQKLAAAEKMSNDIYGMVEDMSMLKDDIKLQSQEGEYADLLDLMQTLKQSFDESDPTEWPEDKKEFWLKKLGEVEEKLQELDGESNIYGDEPWDLFSDLNEAGAQIANAPKAAPSEDDLFKPGDKPKQKFVTKQSIDDHYTEEMGKVQQALINGNITKAQADAMKTELYKEKAKAELDLPPVKIGKDSPKPFKTSKELSSDDLVGVTQTSNPTISAELEDARKDLVEFLLTENLINRDLADDPVEIELEDGTKKDVWRPKDGISDDEVREAILASLREKIEFGADVGEIASLRTHLHNFDVLARKGSYSSEVSPELNSYDRFNHLGPSAQKGVIKKLYEKFDEEELNKVFKKSGKKKAKKDTNADIKAVDEVVSEPEAPKSSSPNKAAVLAQAASVKANGGDVWDEFVDALPEGALLGIVEDHEAVQNDINEGKIPPFKNANAELVYMEGSKENGGKKVGYWIDKRFFDGEAGDKIEEMFPTLYKYNGDGPDDLKPGEKGGLVGGYTLKGDFTPDEGTPLFGKTSGSWSDVRQMYNDDIIDTFMVPPGFDYGAIAEKGSQSEGYTQNALRKKFGNTGGVLVRDQNGSLHYVKRADWKSMSDDDKSMLVVELDVPKKWETWSAGPDAIGQSNVSKIVDDWAELQPDDQKEMLQALFSQEGLIASWGKAHDYQVQQLGITDTVHVPNYDDADGSEIKANIKSWVENISGNPDHPEYTNAFGFYEVMVGPEGNKQAVLVKLGEGMELLAKKHPDLFKQVAKYDGAGNYTDDFGDVDADGVKALLRAMVDPDDVSWIDSEGVDGPSVLGVAQSWMQKLDNKSVVSAQNELEEADGKLKQLSDVTKQALFDAGITADIADVSEAQLREALENAGIDYDNHIAKIKNTSVRREMTKKWIASRKQSDNDAVEVLTEFNKKLNDGTFKKPTDLDGDISATKKAIADAEATMLKSSDAIAAGDSGEDLGKLVSDYVYARAELKAQKEILQSMESSRANFMTDLYKGKTPLKIGGEEYIPKTSSVYFSDSPDIESATLVANAVSPLLKNGEQIGVFQLDNGSYAVIGMDEALEVNLPAPEMIFTSQGKLGMMEADPTDMMDLLTSAGTPPVKDGYMGIENLGVSSDNGIAIGKYVPSNLPEDATPEMISAAVAQWDDHIVNGGSIADVPNEILLESIWKHREGGEGSGRFKFLTKAAGYNDSVSDPKKRTHRFLDTATGHTFVIKSATRNDQEGIRELFGNQVMQSLGFPSSGGRTASVLFTAPNKYANYDHPEADANAPQVSVLLESSEMLYEGKNLGHVKAMPYDQRVDTIARLTPESVANGVVMDSLFRYYDRQGDNWIAIENPDGSVAYHPIDHGNAFGKFKGKKFADKDGIRKNDDSQSREDELGFMFVGLDGEGTWGLAKQSMTTPERRQRFAEAVLRAVHRAETTDYAEEAEKLISGQNLSGQLAERARTSAKNLDEKKTRIKDYVEPMLKELGMSDDEIAQARSVVQSEISTGLLKAGKATKPVMAPGQQVKTMVKSEPVPGEEVFGNAPAMEGAKTVTDTIAQAMATAQGISYASVGGGQVKGGVRFTGIDSKNSSSRAMVMTLRIDGDTADGLVKSLRGGLDASGNTVEVVRQGKGSAILRTSEGKFPEDPTSALGAELGGSVDVAQNWSDTNQFTVARTEEGHIILASSGKEGYGFSLGDTVQVIMKPKEDGSPATPQEVHDLLKRVGIKNPSYTADDEWKSQAAELLVRTYDKVSSSNLSDPLATRLARVAGNHGLTVNDVEPYFDSMGRMRFRLKEEAWEKVKAANPGLAESGKYIVKTMNSYTGEKNVIRAINSGGILSKHEQVASGYGAFNGYAEGGSGHGASAESDLASGGGLGVFMTPLTNNTTKGTHNGSVWGSRGTEVVFDGEEMMRDIGWWAHGPNDGPYGVLNPEDSHISAVGQYDDPLTTMSKLKTFEFLPDAAADMGKAKAVILNSGNSSFRRQVLIDHFKGQGINEINGIPVEQFFVASGEQAKAALPDYEGSEILGFNMAKKTAAVGSPIPPGAKEFPLWLIKGKSSDTSLFPDGKLTKTGSLKTAMARAKKYSNAKPGESFYIFQDSNGHYRVASQKFHTNVIKKYKQYTDGTIQYRFVAGQQMAVLDPDQEVM